ncbi:hypothetical protein FKM82_020143 [Ascaphus truei]
MCIGSGSFARNGRSPWGAERLFVRGGLLQSSWSRCQQSFFQTSPPLTSPPSKHSYGVPGWPQTFLRVSKLQLMGFFVRDVCCMGMCLLLNPR